MTLDPALDPGLDPALDPALGPGLLTRFGEAARDDDTLVLTLRVRDPELLDELSAIADPRERTAFALAALRIGVLSLRTARGQVDVQVVRGEVERMLAALRHGLDQHRERVQLELGSALREYFDPCDGRFETRVRALVQEDGELARVIRQHVEGSDSALARTLARHVGDASPLLRLLDPTNAEGLLAGLQRGVDEALGSQRECILREFSLDNREGALARLVGELTQSHGRLTEDLRGRLDAVVREFSLDAEDSALSRLVGRVERAQQQITSEFTLDCDDSALARLRRELVSIAERQSETIANLEKRVAKELAALVARREADARSTVHGNDFEAALLRWLERRACEQGDLFEATGLSPGLIRNCKKGDAVVELGPEHRAAGARIVVEAKEDASTTLALARIELETARKNRGAQAGVFVLSARSAGEGWPAFHALGEDVFVVWDLEDPASDVRLEAALAVARALSVRAGDEHPSEVDFEAFERAIRDVEKQLQGLEEIQKSAETVESGAGRIKERVRILRANLLRAVETLDRSCDAARRELSRG
jgi:hypothetical protein